MLEIVTPPSEEPITVQEAKDHLRVDIIDDDALIALYITAAREWCEAFLRRAMITQTFDLTLDQWPCKNQIQLPRPPLQSVTSVTYIDQDNVSYTFDSTDYYVVTGSPGRLVLNNNASWPSETLRDVAGITIRFVAGYGLAASVPELFKSAIKLMVGDLYENRESTIVGQGLSVTTAPFGVKSLLMPQRFMSMGGIDL